MTYFRAQAKQLLDAAILRKSKLPRAVRVAVIGSGKAGRYHLQALSEIEGVRIECIVNRGNSDAEKLLSQYGIRKWHTSLDAALAERKFDVAIVAVSPESTYSVTKELFKSDVCCLIEKPLAQNSQEAENLKQLANARGIQAAVGYNRRFYTSVKQAREAILELGAPYSMHIEAPERWGKRLSSESVEDSQKWVILNTTHALDLFTFFMGECLRVLRFVPNLKEGAKSFDFMSMMEFSDGATGSFLSHWKSPGDWVANLYGINYKMTINLSTNVLAIEEKEKRQKLFLPQILDRRFKAGVYLQDFTFLEAIVRGSSIEHPLASLETAGWTTKLAESISMLSEDD